MGPHKGAGRADQEALQRLRVPRHERAHRQDVGRPARALPRAQPRLHAEVDAPLRRNVQCIAHMSITDYLRFRQ